MERERLYDVCVCTYDVPVSEVVPGAGGCQLRVACAKPFQTEKKVPRPTRCLAKKRGFGAHS